MWEIHVQNTHVVNIFVIVDVHLLRNAAVCADGLLQVRILSPHVGLRHNRKTWSMVFNNSLFYV